MNARQLEQLVEKARERKLFLMEGMWTRFLPPITQARAWIAEGRIGEVRLVKADFGFRVGWEPEGRLLNPDLGGGALLDAGVYPISFASMIFGEQPQHVWSTANIGQTGVDEQFSVLLSYSEGRSASLNGAIRLNLSNEAVIYGTEGYIRLPLFLAGKEAYLHVNGQDEPEKFTDDRTCIGYAFEAEEAGRCILEGRTESRTIQLDESLEIMKLMDTIRDIPPGSYADNQGQHPVDKLIVEGSPDGLFSTLPIRAMVNNMGAAGIPAAVSNTAGTYICNNTMYRVLDHIRLKHLPIRAGFVHFPASTEMAVLQPSVPSLPIPMMLVALRVMIRTVVAE
ncbi:hypothetical protein G195_001838 [Phytophthora kernoviae 00238/432]|uniref:Pyroglutamyl-peptidase I n=1 Tax=Phytophthora kernoviae 00238/432 TaxID=1284355 RepID=A0A8J4W9T7_9STRA|nr:hypothetical protein G195_001838 [Phytophthora kernoviae 00238/432]